MRLPDFFIVGAAKAGTTSLYHYLDQHPGIYMSPLKEPAYFSLEVRPGNFVATRQAHVRRVVEETRAYVRGPMLEKRANGIVCEREDYLRLFAAATPQHMAGEASVAYLWSKTAPAEIATHVPHARILMVLREPAERAFAQYLHGVSDGILAQSFRQYIRASLRDTGEAMGIHHPFLEMGFYAEQVQRYLDRFPRTQIGIWLYEDLRDRPLEFLQQVFTFLGVDSGFTPNIATHHNQAYIARMVKPEQLLRRTGVWRWMRRITPAPVKSRLHRAMYHPPGSVTMSAEDRALLLDFYRADIRRLESLLNRDLQTWLA